MKPFKETKAEKARRTFTARGSNCPICKREFRTCPHSIGDAERFFERAVIQECVRRMKRP
jgi:hypothetical protein